MEIFRAFVVGTLAGAIYVWPFAASKSYKRLVISGVRKGRAVALLKKVISLIVGLIVSVGSIILVRGFLASHWRELISACSLLPQSRQDGWRGAISTIQGFKYGICLPNSCHW